MFRNSAARSRASGASSIHHRMLRCAGGSQAKSVYQTVASSFQLQMSATASMAYTGIAP